MQSAVDKYDVVVVGAGPAGLSAARAAAARGTKVLLLEKEREIGYPVKTSGATWIKDANEFGIPAECYNPIKRCIFSSPKNSVTFSYEEPETCILNVRSTYQYLALECAKKGCEIELGASARELLKQNGSVGVVYTQHGQIKSANAKIVIDATGISAVLARKEGLLNTWERIGVGAEIEAYVEDLPNDDTSYLMVGNQLAHAGYAWFFPVSNLRAKIGVGLIRPETSESPLEYLSRFVSKPPLVLGDIGRITPIEFHQWNVPCGGCLETFVQDGLLVVGDAAGHASPLVGEGIRYAMKFGYLSGNIAADAIECRDNSRSNLMSYQNEVKKHISRTFKISVKAQERMARLTDEQWDKVVNKLKVLAPKEFARFLRGDFSVSSTASLFAKHPALATGTTGRMILEVLRGK